MESPADGLASAADELEWLTARLRQALGPGVEVAIAPLTSDSPSDDLWPEEVAAMTKAVAKRRREFAAGRRLARQLLAKLGHPAVAIPIGPDRSPVWPAGVMGSISHTRGLCVVAATHRVPNAWLGIDVEPNDDLPDGLEELVCTGAEREWLDTLPAEQRGRLGRLIFSAKESLYKCQHPLTKTFLGFQEAEISLDPPGHRFAARILHPVGARFEAHPLVGHVLQGPRWMLTGMIWPPVNGR